MLTSKWSWRTYVNVVCQRCSYHDRVIANGDQVYTDVVYYGAHLEKVVVDRKHHFNHTTTETDTPLGDKNNLMPKIMPLVIARNLQNNPSG